MMVVLLLLVAFVCMGLSHGSHEKYYGETHYIRLLRKPDFVEFSPNDNSNVTILWKQGDPAVSLDKKFKMATSYFRISHVTQKDSGRYIMRDKDLKEIFNYTLEVKAIIMGNYGKPGGQFTFTFGLEPNSCNIYFFPESVRQPRKLKNTIVHQGRLQGGLGESDCRGFHLLEPCGISNQVLQISCKGRYEIRDQNDNTASVVSLQMSQITRTFEQKPGDLFEFTFDLEPKSCNIYFFPESGDQSGELTINLVHQGRLQWGLGEFGCTGFDLLEPCGISNQVLQMSCSGRYEVRDQNDNPAIVVSLKMSPLPFEPSAIGIGVGVFFMPLFCCCLKFCCCGKSKSKENGSETAAAEPEVQYREYHTEPVGPRSDQLIDPSGTIEESRTHYPDPPSYTVTDPLVHDHPSVDLPPSYSEVSAPAEQPDAPTVPVHSDPEPTFELKGTTFVSAPPLGSDSTNSDVYTSDKLNFL